MNLINKKYFIYSFKDNCDIYLDDFLIGKDDLSIVLINLNEFLIKSKNINHFFWVEEVFCYRGDLYFIHENTSKILIINYALLHKINFILVGYGVSGFCLFCFNKVFFVFVKNCFFVLFNYFKKIFILLFLIIFVLCNNNVVNENMEPIEKYYISQKKIYQGFEYFTKNDDLKEYKYFNNNKITNNIPQKKMNKKNNNKENKKIIDDDELYFLRLKIKNDL